MRILSIHDGHNASVGLFENGQMIFAIQEERLTRIKNYFGYPKKSVELVMRKFDLTPQSIDYVVFNGTHVSGTFGTTDKRDEIAGVTHQTDLTARLQIIEELRGKEYHKITQKFKKEIGVGEMAIISSNLHWFPIVNDVNDALWIFENSGLEYLQLGDFIIKKKV